MNVRWGRAGREDVDWSPWRLEKLYVYRHVDGKVVLVTLADHNWAEYSPSQLENGVFIAEDYYMQIEGLG